MMNLEKEENYDRVSEVKAFDETKGGVKGLVDAGITKVPRIFFSDQVHRFGEAVASSSAAITVPTIDLDAIEEDSILRRSVAESVLDASAKCGFFQVVNHGIPVPVLDEMLRGVRRFYEQDAEIKKQWYTRDGSKTVIYNSNYDLYTAASANWRDTAYVTMAPYSPNPDELPPVCRDIMIEYAEKMRKLGGVLFELLSEALNLDGKHLNEIGCSEGLGILYHYYPPCPEPELTLGASIHTDINFLTVLLQDNLGGLQFLCNNQWIDIPPLPGALVVNIGDLLQLISNDKFTSGLHRVLASRGGPRVSVASFFTTGLNSSSTIYGPIKELLSDDDPPKYRETTVREYSLHFNTKKDHITSALLDFMV
ncbi:2-oxoglutarate and oxygenase superfamily protein [Perilla frutescens var. frutescens]|nr:2-oxoglutarate and oxygenase superfamily protein [Perilla frutescens var. frutescens]